MYSFDQPITYSNWYPGLPDDAGGNQDCAYLNFVENDWDDLDCNEKLPCYACEKGCPIGWTEIGNECIKVFCFDENKTWHGAQEYCYNHSGHLALPKNDAENQEIAQLAGFAPTWIGTNDLENEGVWVDYYNQPISYSNWYPGTPDNSVGSQHCAFINFIYIYNWDDIQCDSLLQNCFACQKRSGTS